MKIIAGGRQKKQIHQITGSDFDDNIEIRQGILTSPSPNDISILQQVIYHKINM